MDKFYMDQDTQYDYNPGEELYHVFEYNRLNEFGEPYCVGPFLSYEEALKLRDKLNADVRQHSQSKPQRG